MPDSPPHRLFLLDCMALLYRAHFALISKPIFTSDRVNTSALFGFANTVLDILQNQKPTHLGAAFDTQAPTPRHEMFPQYKAQRDEIPEDLAIAIPAAKRLLKAMRIPVLEKDGLEADDLIGAVAHQAEARGDFETFMVTPDKDFGQLVNERTKIYKPGRAGSDVEILGVQEICQRWGIERVDQVIEVLALMGDASDNIPGIKGVGEKTAVKLIQKFGDVETMIARADEIEGKLKDKVKEGAEAARLSRKLVTIMREAPVPVTLDEMKLHGFDDEALKAILVEFEFNALGKRLFGDGFKAGRGRQLEMDAKLQPSKPQEMAFGDGDLFASPASSSGPSGNENREVSEPAQDADASGGLQTIRDVPHHYEIIRTPSERAKWLKKLSQSKSFCFDTETDSLDTHAARLLGIALSVSPHEAAYVIMPPERSGVMEILDEFRPLFTRTDIEKTGHNLKFDLCVLLAHGLEVSGPFFDSMLAHALVDPDQRHGMDYLSQSLLGYAPVSITALIGEKKGAAPQRSMADVPVEQLAEYSAEDADVTLQLVEVLRPKLEELHQHRVFYDIEAPLLPVLADMEHAGVKIDVAALHEFGLELEKTAGVLAQRIQSYTDWPFNLEQTLQTLEGTHPIIKDILDYREVTKLKNTYVDALPETVNQRTGRVHTTFHQLMAATGRMASSDPNLQNIPIRTEQGREIRKAFVPEKEGWVLLSADYSQIELRIMASLSGDEAMVEAFQRGLDIHLATAARVFGVPLTETTPDMRRTAKMVNFGIIYGISAFGLAQRLGKPRQDAQKIIDQYFAQYPGVREYIDREAQDARSRGYVSTLTGRRRYLRDVNSANQTIRAATERVAINAPIQGTAADMIKIAMVKVHTALREGGYETRMLLQVHDELLFEVPQEEVASVTPLIVHGMKEALLLRVPVLVETGVGKNWLEAH
ncbi:MAG: DNA polymerase I [Verrucomicrobia bacterium]|nr:DNA polymerase I [Verrucomicrobiota bacterium]